MMNCKERRGRRQGGATCAGAVADHRGQPTALAIAPLGRGEDLRAPHRLSRTQDRAQQARHRRLQPGRNDDVERTKSRCSSACRRAPAEARLHSEESGHDDSTRPRYWRSRCVRCARRRRVPMPAEAHRAHVPREPGAPRIAARRLAADSRRAYGLCQRGRAP